MVKIRKGYLEQVSCMSLAIYSNLVFDQTQVLQKCTTRAQKVSIDLTKIFSYQIQIPKMSDKIESPAIAELGPAQPQFVLHMSLHKENAKVQKKQLQHEVKYYYFQYKLFKAQKFSQMVLSVAKKIKETTKTRRKKSMRHESIVVQNVKFNMQQLREK